LHFHRRQIPKHGHRLSPPPRAPHPQHAQERQRRQEPQHPGMSEGVMQHKQILKQILNPNLEIRISKSERNPKPKFSNPKANPLLVLFLYFFFLI
jgi:hypothetical protein